MRAPDEVSDSTARDLVVSGLTVTYGRVKALDDVSLSVRHAELFALVGASGSGKSTLLLSIAGFVPIRRGTIVLTGREITSLPPGAREIGIVFQSYALFPHRTVAANIAYSLQVRGRPGAEIGQRVAELLELLHLAGLGRRYPHELSGGQQQRVALARALAFSPKLILLDEPLAAIDRKLRLELQSEIRRVQRATGATLVYVTHDQKEAMAISDRMAVVRDGRILQTGTAREIYGDPADAHVAEFLGGANLLPVSIVAGDGDRCTVDLAGHRIAGVPRPPWLTRSSTRAVLMVRPEHWHLTAPADGRASTVAAQVDELIFEGDVSRVRAVVASGDRLVIRRPTTELATLRVGETLALHLDGRHAKLFEPATETGP